MTDGPFKNLKLTSHHRKVVETLGNDTYTDQDRGGRICHAILRDMSASGDLALVGALLAETAKPQLDLDAIGTMNRIFADNDKTPFANTMQQEMAYSIHHGETLEGAINQALPRASERQTQEFGNRIQEALLQAQESGDAKPHDVQSAMRDLDRARHNVSIESICDAARAGNKNAFKDSVAKKAGAEEGPPL